MENSFGNFLKEKRKEKNLTQKELSKLLFVSESAISKWEKDVARPDISLLPKLSEILSVSEHELITASIDNREREEKKDARRWRIFSASWSLFFYIAYTVALIPCFICNLAIDGTLSWFFIVLSALLLAFTFTNLPKLIKKHKLIILPISSYLSLVLLLGVCCIYTAGNWFWIPTLSVLLALIIIFLPIYIAKYSVFSKIKKYNDFVSVFVDFIFLNVLLIVIDVYSVGNGYSQEHWYLDVALPITAAVYLFLSLLMLVRFLKINRFFKTGIILFLIDALYLLPMLIRVDNPAIQKEIDDANILNADFSYWSITETVENNVHLIIFLTLAVLSVSFFLVAGFRRAKEKTIKTEENQRF